MRLNDTAAPARRSGDAPKGGDRPRRAQGDGGRGNAAGGASGMNSAMADAFAKLKR
ncbi:hypothetical protein D3C73_1560640 [compost metagenome]